MAVLRVRARLPRYRREGRQAPLRVAAEVPELDWALLKKIGDRIASEVAGICRVLYDLTPKPCGTIEFE